MCVRIRKKSSWMTTRMSAVRYDQENAPMNSQHYSCLNKPGMMTIPGDMPM